MAASRKTLLRTAAGSTASDPPPGAAEAGGAQAVLVAVAHTMGLANTPSGAREETPTWCHRARARGAWPREGWARQPVTAGHPGVTRRPKRGRETRAAPGHQASAAALSNPAPGTPTRRQGIRACWALPQLPPWAAIPREPPTQGSRPQRPPQLLAAWSLSSTPSQLSVSVFLGTVTRGPSLKMEALGTTLHLFPLGPCPLPSCLAAREFRVALGWLAQGPCPHWPPLGPSVGGGTRHCRYPHPPASLTPSGSGHLARRPRCCPAVARRCWGSPSRRRSCRRR